MFLSRKDISLLVVFIFASRYVSALESASVEEKPSVVVVILVRNEEHTLPIFLNLFEKINYPKDKLSLFIRSDHNVDGTNEIIDSWLPEHVHKYESINVELTEQPKVYNDEKDGELFWSLERRMQLIHIREEGLEEARKKDADFVWFLDADAFLRDPHVLQKLILEDKIVVAPMLTSLTYYSNFWGDMSESFWYKRSDDYLGIITYQNKGCFPVPLVFKCVLINLNHEDSEVLSFQPSSLSMFKDYQKVPVFDYTIFALNARGNHINIYVCNKEQYGNILDSNDREDPINVEIFQISQLGMEHISKWNSEDTENTELNVSTDDPTSTPSKQNLGFDKVYFINLARQPEKKERMEKLLHSYGLNETWFKAYDGLNLNATFLEKIGMKPLINYPDMTSGEAGCFLSHYVLWEEIVAKKYKQVIIFEDDIILEPDFDHQVNRITSEISRLNLDWDFVYLGRNKISPRTEIPVYGSDILVKPLYSSGIYGYLLSYQGAQKLVDQEPLKKFLPSDWYIVNMCGMDPDTIFSKHFSPLNLKCFARRPSIIEVMLDISDTKHSLMLADIILKDDLQIIKTEL